MPRHAGRSAKMNNFKKLFVIFLPLWGLLLFSRYAAAPVTDFLGDDWPILARGRTFVSYMESAATALGEPDRPIGACLLFSVFRAIDDRPALFTLHNVFYQSLIFFLFIYCMSRLTGSTRATIIAGVIFTLLPHPADLYNWATVAIYLPAFVAYLASAACWIHYARGGAFAWAPVSGLFMLLGSATFEAGFALPLAFLALIRRDRLMRDLSALAFTCAGSGIYLLWRFTRGFGTAQGVLYDPRQPAMDLYYLAWNAKEFVSSWIGENLITTITQGLSGFSTLPEWEWRGLFAAAIVITYLLGRLLIGMKTEPPMKKNYRTSTLLFTGLWFLAAALPCVVSWQAGRLHFLPGMAVSIIIGTLLAERPPRHWIPALSVAAFILLLSNLGSAQLWQDSGRFHRRLYLYIESTKSQWQDADVVLFTTDSLRRRLTNGILPPDDRTSFAWAKYGSADLIRGTAPSTMLHLANPGMNSPVGILDIESGIQWDGDQLFWHDRWNPDRPHITPRDRVFEIDILEAAIMAPTLTER